MLSTVVLLNHCTKFVMINSQIVCNIYTVQFIHFDQLVNCIVKRVIFKR